MADTVTSEARSRNMAAIKSKDTEPEIYLRKRLFSLGYRYRKNVKTVPGHPDIYLAKYHTAVFINGCFWHRHPGCKYAYMPKSRIEYWKTKFEKNIERDKNVREELRKKNVKCLIVWECTIRKMKRSKETEETVISQVIEFLSSSELYQEI